MDLRPISEQESDQLKELLDRAIANNQLLLRIQSLDDDGAEQYDGHGCSDYRWRTISTESSGEEPVDPENESGPWHEITQHEVHIFIPNENAQYLAENHRMLRIAA